MKSSKEVISELNARVAETAEDLKERLAEIAHKYNKAEQEGSKYYEVCASQKFQTLTLFRLVKQKMKSTVKLKLTKKHLRIMNAKIRSTFTKKLR